MQVSLFDYLQPSIFKDWRDLEYIDEQPIELCLTAIQQDWRAFLLIRKQTPELCRAVVLKDWRALEFVLEQTHELCLLAIQQNWRAIHYIRTQTPEICLAAVQQDAEAFKYVKVQTPEVCLLAVQKNGNNLKYVKLQTDDICLAAVKNKHTAVQYVHPQYMYLFRPGLDASSLPIETLPDTVNLKDYTDPITLDDLKEGELYGWIVENEQWYLAGSLTYLNQMIQMNFNKSTLEEVFIPIKNTLVPVENIRWVPM